jgi:hypothetical protein
MSSCFSICPEATGLSSVGLFCDSMLYVLIVVELNDIIICIYGRHRSKCIDMTL